MGHPLPLSHWPGKPSFCLKSIQSREVGWLWEGRWPLPCKVKWLCSPPPRTPPPRPPRDWFNSFPPLFMRTLVQNACSDSNSHLKYGSDFMASHFLCCCKSLIITISNGAFGQLKFCWCSLGVNRYASYKPEV